MNRPRRPQPMQPQQPMQRVSPGMYRNAQGGLQRGNQQQMQRPMPQQRPPMQQPQQAPNPWGQVQQIPNIPPNGWGNMGQLNLPGNNPGNWSASQMPQGQWSGFAGGFGQAQPNEMDQTAQFDQMPQQPMQRYPRPAYQPPANPQGLLSQPPMKE